ncbi:MAG: glycosyltransferase family 39 protein [Deltaproteobacteria bacterium]|nr:glycosyltransferase family 39 protein [Deltaproteobacteria bacterium]
MSVMLIHHMGNIAWVVAICLISTGVGKLALSRARGRIGDSGESIIFSTGVGFAIVGYSIFILAVCQMLYSEVIYAFTALCSILSCAGWYIDKRYPIQPPLSTRRIWHDTPPINSRTALIINRFSLVMLAIFLTACMFLVLTPEVEKDALAYHLAVPKMFLEHHGIYFIPGNIFSNYPLFIEMLYTWALFLRGEVAAKGIHFAMVLLILFSMWKFGKRYLPDNRFAPLSLLIFFAIPSVFQNAHTAYCDLGLAFYTFVAVYAFLNWFSTRETLWIILCGVFSGIAMSIKFGGLYLPLSGGIGILWGLRRYRISTRRAIRLFSLYILFTFMAGAPFYLKNWIMTGNPLYPLFYPFFGGRGWSADQAQYYDFFIKHLGMGRELIDYLLLPWNLSFHARMESPIFDGLIGPLFILVLPFAIGVRRIAIEMKIVWVYCLMAFLFWASSAQQIRYLLPLFPFLALLAGHTFSHYLNNKRIFALLSIFIASGLAINGYHILHDFKKINPIKVLAGHEDKHAFLDRLIPSYEMLRHVNTQLPENSYILLIYMKNLGYLYERPFYSDSMFESYTVETILNLSKTPEDVRLALKKKGFTHILYDINYVMGKTATLSEENKTLFREFQNRYLRLVNSEKDRYFLYRFAEPAEIPAS